MQNNNTTQPLQNNQFILNNGGGIDYKRLLFMLLRKWYWLVICLILGTAGAFLYGKYQHQIYGEQEVGGTGWLYLSPVPFDQIGFRTDLGTTPYPEYTQDFLNAVPVFVFGMPALLYGLSALAEKASDANNGPFGNRLSIDNESSEDGEDQ